jgi:hypothetical protein
MSTEVIETQVVVVALHESDLTAAPTVLLVTWWPGDKLSLSLVSSFPGQLGIDAWDHPGG